MIEGLLAVSGKLRVVLGEPYPWQRHSRPSTAFDRARSVIPLSPEVLSMPTPARATEPPIETLPLDERIQRRAHELYVQRGNQSGSELDDWLQAEEEVLRAREDGLDTAGQ